MALTKRQLCERVLRQGLPVADALTSPASEDVAFVASVYDTKHAEWKDRGLVYWPNTAGSSSTALAASEVPEVVADALVALLANACGRAFGEVITLADQMAQEQILLIPLRRHIAKSSKGEATQTDYF